MISVLRGYILYLLYKRVSILSIVDDFSKLSKKSRICRFAKIRYSEIGSYSYVGPHTRVIKTEIGKFCSIADYCIVGLPSHTISLISTSPIFTESKNGTRSSWIAKNTNNAVTKSVKVGNDVWIGTRAIIMGGVSIGNGAIIGAGSIVTKDVPPYAIVAGVPAKIIRYRFGPLMIDKLLEVKWWELSVEVLKNKIGLFQKGSITISDIEKINKF